MKSTIETAAGSTSELRPRVCLFQALDRWIPCKVNPKWPYCSLAILMSPKTNKFAVGFADSSPNQRMNHDVD